jgi:hypothetical protein
MTRRWIGGAAAPLATNRDYTDQGELLFAVHSSLNPKEAQAVG